MSFTVIYHPDVSKVDLPKVPGDIRSRIKRAIAE